MVDIGENGFNGRALHLFFAFRATFHLDFQLSFLHLAGLVVQNLHFRPVFLHTVQTAHQPNGEGRPPVYRGHSIIPNIHRHLIGYHLPRKCNQLCLSHFQILANRFVDDFPIDAPSPLIQRFIGERLATLELTYFLTYQLITVVYKML